MVQKLRRLYFLILIMIMFVTGVYSNWYFNLENEINAASVETEAKAVKSVGREKENLSARQMVYASGEPVGIYIKTKGVLVLGTQEVKTGDNRNCSPAEHRLKSGDYILKVNDTEIQSKPQFLSLLQKNEENEVILTISRNGEQQKIKLKPVYSAEDHCYQIGAWIRNDTQGIGTVTYITEEGKFAALGHGINDCDLGVKMDISKGSVYKTDIATIMKGKVKDPGEIIGTIDYIPEKYLGIINKNTECGIFGEFQKCQDVFRNGEKMEVAKQAEIEEGKAYIRTSVSGKSKDYTIEIEKISHNKKDLQKALQIKVTDEELITLTGGIIQGLSGSPIIQNGKLIGAVTHVFVDAPTKGYGICAETMMDKSR